MKRIHFYATRDDILLITDSMESRQNLKYILTLHSLHPKYDGVAPIYESGRDIQSLGDAAKNQTGGCERYIVVERSVNVIPVSRFIGKDTPSGGKWYVDYEIGNCPEGVEFNAGGLWSSEILINGLIQTWSDDPAAQKLMRQAAAAMKKYFPAKIDAYWVGPEAFELLKSGFRLTSNAAAGPEFDLKLPNA
ncbi:hypothetical protein [Burkholderia cepacia]|uniref:hypothetical protein n=1 Tax=Burkholderia cepacia TaxID=292 RepID=UPI0012D93F90|nr:hypothetical protein [Burkholderia cepacia]